MLTSPNGKSYIGQTTRPIQKRFEQHQKSSRCIALYNAIQKYGWDNFEKDYYECPDEDLDFDEELLVREMETMVPGGYNLKEGGGSRGKMSEESKQKNRYSHIGKKHTNQTKQKMSEAQRGKTLSKEHKQKISESMSGEKHPMYGKTPSEETRQKRNDALRGDKNNRSKRTYQYDLEGNYIRSFGSCGEAGLYIKKPTSKISLCACGKRKSAYGFIWSYDEIVM